jgi:hypothetical protein
VSSDTLLVLRDNSIINQRFINLLQTMKKISLTVLLLSAFVLSFGQPAPQQQTPEQAQQRQQQNATMARFRALYDSLTPQQRNMLFTDIKHVMDPEVPYVQPGNTDDLPPADAIVLFDGTDINKEWEETGRNADGTSGVKPAVTWVINNGAMESAQGSGSVRTKRSFDNFQLHIEWRTPSVVTGEGQGRGNSGVIIQGVYEVQILDSYNNKTYKNGQAGAVYMQYAPLVNVSRKPGEWQSYDIIYTAPVFKDGAYLYPPRITVFHNGVLVQNNVSIQGPTVSPGIPYYTVTEHGPAPISLQQHGNPVGFRNVWIREL